ASGGLGIRQTEFSLAPWRMTTLSFELFSDYLWKLVEPFRLNAFPVLRVDLTPSSTPVLLGVGISLAFAALVAALAWRSRRQASLRPLAALLAACALPILPFVVSPKSLGFIVFGERFLYAPSIGFCWLLGWAAAAAAARFSIAAASPLLLLCGAYGW